MQIRNPKCLLLPEHLLLLVGFAIPLLYERPVFSGHLFLRLPCPYATPPFLHHIHSSHIGDEFGRNECGGLTFLHTQNGNALMSRDYPRPKAPSEIRLEPLDEVCRGCPRRLWLAYHHLRTVATLDGLVRLRLVIRRCANPECEFSMATLTNWRRKSPSLCLNRVRLRRHRVGWRPAPRRASQRA
jgi:hypothetical protein